MIVYKALTIIDNNTNKSEHNLGKYYATLMLGNSKIYKM